MRRRRSHFVHSLPPKGLLGKWRYKRSLTRFTHALHKAIKDGNEDSISIYLQCQLGHKFHQKGLDAIDASQQWLAEHKHDGAKVRADIGVP